MPDISFDDHLNEIDAFYGSRIFLNNQILDNKYVDNQLSRTLVFFVSLRLLRQIITRRYRRQIFNVEILQDLLLSFHQIIASIIDNNIYTFLITELKLSHKCILKKSIQKVPFLRLKINFFGVYRVRLCHKISHDIIHV